jgi:NDP-sugar pyrophosphorylase family protein
MRIVIPMSGIGKRFVDAGYSKPKPLIEVEGKPIIHHIIDLFPGETEFDFICNSLHLAETNMRAIILQKVPSARIHEVDVNNRKGPVDAVLQIANTLPNDEEIIVSYCDYGTEWEYQAFLDNMRSNNADGGIAAYIGFHPHMLKGDNYAFLQHENMWVTDIQEKKSFTKNKMNEYASNGTYYFRTGAIMKQYFEELVMRNLHVNNEYYVSLVYKLMIEDKKPVRVFEIKRMLQWGTPSDLEDYLQWSNYFLKKKRKGLSFRGTEPYTLILPMAGAGSRFRIEGYDLPKPLLSVDENEMVVQAVNCLPPAKRNIFVTLQEHVERYPLETVLSKTVKNLELLSIPSVTEGQACTCEFAIQKGNLSQDEPLLISACDNGAYYDTEAFYKLIDDPSIDVIVWSFTNNPTSKLYPHSYAWLDVDKDDNICDVSIKKEFEHKNAKHCIIGTMYFRKTSLFLEGLEDIYKTNFRTNGEFYVDNLLVPLIQKGYRVKVFEVENYLCWGTPNDYKTYTYWSDYFQTIE